MEGEWEIHAKRNDECIIDHPISFEYSSSIEFLTKINSFLYGAIDLISSCLDCHIIISYNEYGIRSISVFFRSKIGVDEARRLDSSLMEPFYDSKLSKLLHRTIQF